MKNSIKNNLEVWNVTHDWSLDGDEWSGQAQYCDVSYDKWKQSIVDLFLSPNLGTDRNVLEIAPGHGRWTEYLVGNCNHLYLADLSPSCLEHCKTKFKDWDNITYIETNGMSLSCIEPDTVDFMWSFDAFVHMQMRTIKCYLADLKRVLSPSGIAIIHHANRKHQILFLAFLRNFGQVAENIYNTMSMGNQYNGYGWRSDVSKLSFRQAVDKSGLKLESQLQMWGANNKFGVPRFNDYISILSQR